MLTFQWRRVTRDEPASSPTRTDVDRGSIADTNPELKIRSLMDDPLLRALLATTAPRESGSLDNVVSVLPVRAPGRSLSSALRQGLTGRSAA